MTRLTSRPSQVPVPRELLSVQSRSKLPTSWWKHGGRARLQEARWESRPSEEAVKGGRFLLFSVVLTLSAAGLADGPTHEEDTAALPGLGSGEGLGCQTGRPYRPALALALVSPQLIRSIVNLHLARRPLPAALLSRPLNGPGRACPTVQTLPSLMQRTLPAPECIVFSSCFIFST